MEEEGILDEVKYQEILNGNAGGKKIPYTIYNHLCVMGTMRWFLPFCPNLGIKKNRDLLVISMCLNIQNPMALGQPATSKI